MTVSENLYIQSPFLVSAPGKVIIFGEHAAVYGKPAIAAALSLRTYLLVSPGEDLETVTLRFNDINFSKSWKIGDFPWADAERYRAKVESDSSDSSKLNKYNRSTDELVPELVSALTEMLVTIDDPLHYSAAYAFVYLYVNLCLPDMRGHTFTVRSTLPIGAGLGSSASLSVCIASALSLLGGHIKKGTVKVNDLSSADSEDASFIDSWAFLAEKCIHGNPSGIDNAVACHGGAVMFQRMKSSVPSVRTTMRNFPSFKLLLTNTKQPRRTANLVAKVSALINDFPKSSSAMLDAIDNITKEGYKLMIRPFFDEDAKKRFRELIRMNHGLLVSLGVSHPTLERVKLYCDEISIGDTKLTGAGGGGCAITLLKDDIKEEVIDQLREKLLQKGFETFETTLGGKGVALCIPDPKEVHKFSSDGLIALESREQIETSIGVNQNPDNWTFW